jgi:hypothetical protein
MTPWGVDDLLDPTWRELDEIACATSSDEAGGLAQCLIAFLEGISQSCRCSLQAGLCSLNLLIFGGHATMLPG